MTVSSLHCVSQLFTTSYGRSLNRRLGLNPKGINPVIFHSCGTCDCPLAQSRGLSYFKCLSQMKNSENTPRIYVGTYGMYNSGSLFGKWFDLSEYSDAEEFFKDCYEYHRNEFFSSGCRPELMFQDWENIPSFLISESSLHQDAFRYFEAVSEMDEDRAEAFELYCSDIVSWPANGNDLEETLEGFNEAYHPSALILRLEVTRKKSIMCSGNI